MKLSNGQILDIATGSVSHKTTEDGLVLYRFTREQIELFRETKESYYLRSLASSGIRLHFRTDSEYLDLKVGVKVGGKRTYFSFDLFINGKFYHSLNNFSENCRGKDYTVASFPLGQFEKRFLLGKGEKEICLYLPWSTETALREVSLSDGASLIPIRPKKTLLAFGDSITQGFDALHPCEKYISRLADSLDAVEYNKAIGGIIFFPPLAATKENLNPDYITVALGTNDWSSCEQEVFLQNCRDFFSNLRRSYPEPPVFVLTPIWRKDESTPRKFGAFSQVDPLIRSIASQFESVTVISGYDLVPHRETLYADFRLHPNDEGFHFYYKSLRKKFDSLL